MKYPPFSENHLKELEQKLVLARVSTYLLHIHFHYRILSQQQLADLIQCRKTMYLEAEKMDLVKLHAHLRPSRDNIVFKGEEEATSSKNFILSASKVNGLFL